MSPASLRIRALYFFLFLFLGGQGNYLALWLESHGWTDVQVGWLGAVRSACLIVVPLFWGRLADRDGHPGRVLVITAVGSLLGFLPHVVTTDYVLLLVATLTFHVFREGILPAADTATLQLVSREGGTFGRHRIWGSLGFITGGFVLAACVSLLSREATPWVLALMAVATLGPVFLVSRAEAQLGRARRLAEAQPDARVEAAQGLRAAARHILQPDVLRLFGVIFLWRVAMSGFFQFLPLHLGRLGVPDGAIGAYWAVGVVAEILLFARAVPWFGRFEARRVYTLCMAACALQCGLFAITTNPWVFLALMSLHGLTFGIAFYTAVIWLGALVPRSALATVQALLYAFGFGLGGAVSSVTSGYLYSDSGGAGLFGAAAAVALVTTLLAVPLLRDRTRFGDAATR